MHPIKIAESFVGTPYCLGSTTIEGGVDCFSYIFLYMEQNNIKFPDKWEGFDYDNYGEQYSELFKKDPDKAKKVMVKFLMEFTDEVTTKRAIPGDILVLSLKGSESRYFLGVMIGSNKFYSVVESQGVVSTKLKGYDIKRVFRCRKH